MKKSVIAILYVVIMTLVNAIVATTFFEMDNALGDAENFVDEDKIYAQQSVETECKSPCPSSAEICIEMCA